MVELERVDAALPPVGGKPGLTQGRYGERGNLELVVPAVDGGMWVLWFNADAGDHRSGAAVGEWSGGLHFGGGTAVRRAAVTQVPHGPDFLEVVALGDARAERWYWTPSDGFVAGGPLPGELSAVSAVAATRAALHVVTAGGCRELVHAVAGVDRYPHARWRTRMLGLAVDDVSLTADGEAVQLVVRDGTGLGVLRHDGARWSQGNAPPGRWRELAPITGTTEVVAGTDPAGRPQLSVRDGARWSGPVPLWRDVTADAVAAAWTTLDGGRLDVVLRVGTALLHAWGSPGAEAWRPPRPVRSRVWARPGTPVHRR